MSSKESDKTMKFCNINFTILNKEQLFTRKEDETKCIATVNAQFIVLANTTRRYMEYINANYATFDGEIPLKKARKYNPAFKNAQKLPGSEIVYDFAEYAREHGLKTFYLGGYKDSNSEAVKIIREKYGAEIEGFSPDYEPYPFSKKFTDECLDAIGKFKPHILFVGFGAPKQEYFIEENKQFLSSIGVQYVIGCGGTFEFVSGKIKRAPKWIQNTGLEGIWRLFQEFGIERIKRILYSFRFFKYIKGKPDFEKST